MNELRLAVRDARPEATFLTYNQTIGGIDVFEGQIKLTLSRAGEVVQVASGEIAPGLSTPTTPRLRREDAETAARSAARAQTAGRFLREPELVIFVLDASTARLAYRFFLEIDSNQLYEILIDAEDGTLLFRHNAYAHAAQGRVWMQSPSQGARQLVTFPDGWLPAGSTVTTGNNADAFVDADGDDTPDSQNTGDLWNGRASSATQLFDFSFGDGTLGIDPRGSKAAAVTNLFYFVNLAHDFFYNLGFTEASGNFQTDNFGRGGVGGDPVIAEAQNGLTDNNSSFAPTPEGTSPRLRAGLFTRSTPSRTDDLDSDYDGQIIVHEYAHGVSNRLVGGGTSTTCLDHIQSGALGEGWSDYFAISYFNNPVLGAYTSQNATHGLRRQSYEGYTFTFEDIGNSGYEVHDDGEIWAAALWDLRKVLGPTSTDRLVVNGLKATPCNPSMTDARDAILAADLASNGGANRALIWTIFAKHGLGYSARGADGTPQTGTLYDAAYDLPPGLQSLLNPAVTSQPLPVEVGLGGLFSYAMTVTNPNAGTLNFELTAAPAGMTLSPSGVVTWLASFTAQRVKITVTDGKGGKVVHGFLVPVMTHLATDQSVLISGAEDSTGYAWFDVPSGVPVLQVTLRGDIGDADLFVADPDGNFESSERKSSNETLTFPNPKPGRWQIEVDGYQAYSSVSLKAALVTPTLLAAPAVLKNLAGVAGSETLYRIVIPEGTSTLQVSTQGFSSSGDVDLYLKFGKPVSCQGSLSVSTACNDDYRSENPGSNENISLANPAAGDWYIDLSGYEAYSGVTLTITVPPPPPPVDLAISISHVGPLTPGQRNVRYTVIVTNAGSTPSYGPVTVTNSAPTGLTLTFGSTSLPPNWQCTQTACTLTATVLPGASFPNLLISASVAANAPASVTTVVTVSTPGDTNASNNTASDTAIVLQPDLAISLSHTGAITAGQTGAVYSVSVTNAGSAPTSGPVTVTESLPQGLTATAINGAGWTCALATLSCTRNDALAPAGSYPPIQVTVNVAPNPPATVTNSVTVSGGGEINLSNSTATDVVNFGQSTNPTITLVANAFGENPLIAPNMWVEIKGSNLAPAGHTRIWGDADFANNLLPTQLDGVSVMVNGKPAYVYYISPTQVNILTPPDPLSGSIQVQLMNNGTASNAANVSAQAQSLSFFEFVTPGGLHYVYGRHIDGTLIGPGTLFPGSSSPVKPGEDIYIAATGFGPTDVPIVSGAPTQTGNLPPPFPVVKVGNLPATVSFAGLVGVGTYQINFKVPLDAPDGDLPLTATYNGLSIQSNLLITVQR